MRVAADFDGVRVIEFNPEKPRGFPTLHGSVCWDQRRFRRCVTKRREIPMRP
jgi:hypothetical protein